MDTADRTFAERSKFSSDAAFADTEDRKSSEGYLFKLFGGVVDWPPPVKLTGGNVSSRM